MFGAMPSTSAANSEKVRSPSSRAPMSRSVQRSPMRRAACSRETLSMATSIVYSHLQFASKELSMLQELSDLVRQVSAKAGPSVVSVGRHGRGSGAIVAPGKVLTCAHNLRDRTSQVRFLDGRTAQGTVAGSDLDGDLVVLDVDTGELPALE